MVSHTFLHHGVHYSTDAFYLSHDSVKFLRTKITLFTIVLFKIAIVSDTHCMPESCSKFFTYILSFITYNKLIKSHIFISALKMMKRRLRGQETFSRWFSWWLAELGSKSRSVSKTCILNNYIYIYIQIIYIPPLPQHGIKCIFSESTHVSFWVLKFKRKKKKKKKTPF